MGTDVLGDEQPGDLALHGCGGDDRTRIGDALRTRGDVRRFAEHFAGRVHHHRAGIEADAGGELRRKTRQISISWSGKRNFAGRDWRAISAAECGRTAGIRFADHAAPH